MKEYVIFTDSSADLSDNMLKKRGVISLPLSFHFDDEIEHTNDEMKSDVFYNRMRSGECAKTSAVNPEAFVLAFEKQLLLGNDILYIGFSSGLSTTYNSACTAVNILKDKYPDSRLLTVDSLAASGGLAMLIDLVIQKKQLGSDIVEAAEYAESVKNKICHWFTVDDLVYLKRGGRISPTAAFFGNMLGIKPILHVDNDGKLCSIQKVRGRKLSIQTLANKFLDSYDKSFPATAYISHADCYEDAMILSQILKEHRIKNDLITNVGPVIGAHSGPNTLALFFIGKSR